MRTALAISSFFCGLAAANPVAPRQEIDLGAYKSAAAKATAVAPPIGDAAPENSAAYNPTSVSALAVAQITSAASDATKTVEVVAAKRAATSCTTRTYNGPQVTSPADTPEAFLGYQPFKDAAESAALDENVPTAGYQVVDGFVNLQATAINSNYLTYVSSRLTGYDVDTCAAVCDGMAGCNSFVIYYERDPLVVNPDTQVPDVNLCPANSSSSSATLIKCAFYGQPVTSGEAVNSYQYWGSFKIVYAGANAYYKYAATVDGFKAPVSFGGAAINAPAPVINHGYLRSQTFGTNVPFDPSLCAASCNAQTTYNAKHSLYNGAACVFFDAFIVYENGLNGVFTCNYYSIEYDSSYAKNVGQYDSAGNHYTIGNSYGYYIDLDLPSVCSSLLVSSTTVTTW
ncbi:hypothetical protein GQ53DRAFT_853156 [Thozetella sp. PMI_491]|nr:hypothetical protein GQ53DRAFT_853156 [Thozetella sp. PMI_491]